MTKLSWLSPVLLLCACAAPAPETSTGVARGEALSQAYAAQPSSELWARQAASSDPLELLMVEAELGARGETTSGTSYIGSRTASTAGLSRYARTGAATAADGVDCSDFPSAAAAQRYFLAGGGPTSDPHNLDGDGDGLACEWGVRVQSIATQYRPKPKPTPSSTYRSSSSGVCHVGPRGGTYTITAGGYKDYDGC